MDVEPELLDAVSTLGSGTRVIGVYAQRWSEPGGGVLVYLHGVDDPGNVGSGDPLGARALRRSGGARARAAPTRSRQGRAGEHGFALRAAAGAGDLDELPVTVIALDARAERPLPRRGGGSPGPLVLCLGAEREGLPDECWRAARARASPFARTVPTR